VSLAGFLAEAQAVVHNGLKPCPEKFLLVAQAFQPVPAPFLIYGWAKGP